MTREEHIYQLKQYLQGKSISMCPASSLYWQEHWEEVIKALEQEPFINKPCVSSGVCEHDKQKVLEKIRAEIEKAVWEDVVVSLDGTDEVRIPLLEPNDVFEIIDKYKTESEPQESEKT